MTEGIRMLEISATIMGKKNVIYPTIIWDEDAVILVDTGYPGQLPLFVQAFNDLGIPLENLSKIIITHQDIDHIGCLPAILTESSKQIEVLAHAAEKPFIEGQKQLIKLTEEAIQQAVSALPDGIPDEFRHSFRSVLENPPKATVDGTLSHGVELPYSGGIIVIETPGHTPGHISLYHKTSKTLIAGDAMVVVDGQLQGPPPQYCVDSSLAIKSLKQLTKYDIETVICYHGGSYQGDIAESIHTIVRSE